MVRRLARQWTAAFGVLLCAAGTEAQGIDGQVRFLGHAQVFAPQARIGFAGWAILPDVTQQPLRSVALAGAVFRSAGGWVEVMGGAAWTPGKSLRPVVNVRVQEKWAGGNTYLEGQLRPQFLLGSFFWTKPFRAGKFSFQLGPEGEAIRDTSSARPATKMWIGLRTSPGLPLRGVGAAGVVFVDQRGGVGFRTYLRFGK